MIDFTKGGYRGDDVEEMFKGFTTIYLPHYWYFREVLRASDRRSAHWHKKAGGSVTEEEVKDLFAISMILYHVYTCVGEAISFAQALDYELARYNLDATRHFEVKKNWKAAYSSLYTSLNAVSNLLLIIAGEKPVLKPHTSGVAKNYTPQDAINTFRQSIPAFSTTISNCRDRLEIRNHLDHYWTIWTGINQGIFVLDKDFSKGYVVTSPPASDQNGIDARSKLIEDIINTSKDFDTLFLELSRPGGSFDKYLNTKGIVIDYSDYGAPHYGTRPRMEDQPV
jgi:hypothetical protein